MFETLLTDEECLHAVDMGQFYRVPADRRELNGDPLDTDIHARESHPIGFNSNNTVQLSVAQVREKLMSLPYIRNMLATMK